MGKGRLDFLDLAESDEIDNNELKSILKMMSSLNGNYWSYVDNTKTVTQTRRNFFGVPKIALPPVAGHSSFKCLEPFVLAAKEFLDGDKKNEAVSQLLELEKEVAKGYYQYIKKHGKFSPKTNKAAILEKVLRTILKKFEEESGFLPPKTITKDAGPDHDGLISPSEFNRLTRAGHPFIDYGATEQHGPHSHRVQFYLLHKYFQTSHFDKFFSNPAIIRGIHELMQKHKISLPVCDDYDLKSIIRSKFISIFYRFFGIKGFTQAFDWKIFKNDLAAENGRVNEGRVIPKDMNIGHIWVQLFDRRGYNGDLSVPSTIGFLQLLGALTLLPTMGKPNIMLSISLRTILDLTRPLRPTKPTKPTKPTALEALDLAIPPAKQ